MLSKINLQKVNETNIKYLTISIQRSYRIRFPPKKPDAYEIERRNYKKALHEYRLKNIKEHWERQTQIENNYIEKWNQLQEQKRKNDLIRFRNSIVKISAGTKLHLEQERKKYEEDQSKLRKYFLEEETKRQNRLHIVKMLNMDSKDWYTMNNVEQQMQENTIIPDFVYDQTSYYMKLHEQAMMLEQGNYEGLEKSFDESLSIKSKNARITPIYARIVGLIKHMRETEENKVIDEYKHLKNLILTNKKISAKDAKEKIEKLRSSYQLLVEKVREEANTTTAQKLDILHRQCLILYNLLKLWESYIFYVKLEDVSSGYLDRIEENEQVYMEQGTANITKKDLKEEDGQISANEKHTTDTESEEEINYDKLKLNPEKGDALKGQKETDINKEIEAISEEVEQKFIELGYDDVNKLEEEFKQEFDLSKDKDKFLYGFKVDEQAIQAAEFLKNKNLETILPPSLLESLQDFTQAKLVYNSIKDIERDKIVDDDENPNTLRSNAVSEIYKNSINNLINSESLSRKEKNKANEIKTLLNKICEIRIQEPKMLLKIIEIYNPINELD